MGKYLQDIMIRLPEINRKGLTQEQVQQFYLQFKDTLKAIPLIEDLYNYNLPKKLDTGHNIWRFIIQLNCDKEQDFTTECIGGVYRINRYFDNDALKQQSKQVRKEALLAIVSNGIETICSNLNCSFNELHKLTVEIKQKQIVFNEPYKSSKMSLNKAMTAQLWAVYTEEERATYLKVADKKNDMLLHIKLCDCHFSLFDRVLWVDNNNINVYKINPIHSYKRKKVAEDFYHVSIEGDIEYMPQTREAIFDYGIELMQEEATFTKGIEYVKKADSMQHGKAKNILLHLQANPAERDIKVLLQQPDKSMLQKARR